MKTDTARKATKAPRPTAYRSRRKPLLRLVGGAPDPYRHQVQLTFAGPNSSSPIVEVITFEEMRALPPARLAELRDEHTYFARWAIPGIGFMFARKPISTAEARDVRDIEAQAWEDWRTVTEHNW